MLNSFAFIFIILVVWQFSTFCIPAFSYVIFTMVVILIVILFTALIFDKYIKLTCITGIFINFLIHIFITFLRIIFRISHVWLFFFLAIILLLCVFVNIFTLFLFVFFTNSNDYILSSGSAFFRTNTDIDKVGYCLPSNNNDYLKNLWLFYATLFFSWKLGLITEVT